jgi:L,D-transpeptidase ErfK/SrfK
VERGNVLVGALRLDGEGILMGPLKHLATSRCLSNHVTHAIVWSARLLVGLFLALSVTQAYAATYLLPSGSDVVGRLLQVTTREEDTLSDVARRFGVGWEALKRANPGVDPWLPGAGTRVIVPTQHVLPNARREGLVLNLPEMRIYYYPRPKPGTPPAVMTYPVSIGRMDWSTPLGLTRVTAKIRNPVWYPPASIRAEHAEYGDELPKIVDADPDNPLGEYALRLAIPGYLIHGTNKPYGIGMRVTHGCVRLYPEDIEALFRLIPKGTPVRIIDQPHKAGWRDGALYLESHPPLDEQPARSLTPAVRAVVVATTSRMARIDWDAVEKGGRETRGLPLRVSH